MLKDLDKINSLVALIPTISDWEIAKMHNWYRIPVKSAPQLIRKNELRYISFYFPKIFAEQAYRIAFYAKVEFVSIKHRSELFPEEPINSKSSKEYYVIHFNQLQKLPTPVVSAKPRRIIFIPTTEFKLFNATQLNDLFSDSQLEEIVWNAFKRRNIPAERQYNVHHNNASFMLDFAIFCKERNIDIECDGDGFHTKPKHVKYDKSRNNILSSMGWTVLRFTSDDIQNRLDDSMQIVHDSIRTFGGIAD